MDGKRAALSDISVAVFLRLGIGDAADRGVAAVCRNLGDLRLRRVVWNEDARGDAKPSSRESDRRAVVAARSGCASDRGRPPRQEIVERPPRLERAAVLKEFKLERDRRRVRDGRGGLENWGAADMRRNALVSGANVGWGYGRAQRRDFIFPRANPRPVCVFFGNVATASAWLVRR